jgi:hypothetical protein
MLQSLIPIYQLSIFNLRSLVKRWVGLLLQRSRSVWIMLLTSLLLSGCIQYDVELQFDSPNRGRIVQQIQVEERLKSFSGASTQQWLETVEQRTRTLGGRVKRRPNQALTVTIPFNDETDLETKFNQFFGASDPTAALSAPETRDLPEIISNLAVRRSNLLLVERNRLRYDLDLRSLGVLSSDGNLLISPGTLIDLEFRLKTPWGARSVTASTTIPKAYQEGKELIWRLVPGELNQVEAVFWLPSPLGIGTLVIIFLVLAGIYLKDPQFFVRRGRPAPETIDSKTGIVS